MLLPFSSRSSLALPTVGGAGPFMEAADHAGHAGQGGGQPTAQQQQHHQLTQGQTQALEYMLSIVDQIAADDKKQLFKSPVDGTIYPTYYARIQEPMCFDEMREKLRRQQYRTLRAFRHDMELIFENAK